MKIIHHSDVPTEHRISPKGTFELHRQHVSLALGEGVRGLGSLRVFFLEGLPFQGATP